MLFPKKIILFATIFFSYCFVLNSNATMLSINGSNVNLRSGPSNEASIKYTYGKGVPLRQITKKNDWVKVSDFENDQGWIHESLLTKTPHLIVKANRNSKKKINIRSGPSIKHEIVAKAYYGVVFKTLEQKNGWARVEHESGVTGWVKRSLLWGF